MKSTKTIESGIALLIAWLASILPAAAADAASGESMTLRQVIEYGGALIYVLAGMSVIGLAMVLYFFMVLRSDHVIPPALVSDLKGLLEDGKWKEADAVCRSSASPAASVAKVALDYVTNTDHAEPALLREIIEGEGGRQATRIQTQTQYLLDIAVIAPMIGLLGTVMGMLKAFNTVALDLAKAKPMLLAGGVSQALVTTVAGLIVAIPAMIAYAYFRGRASKIISDLETTSTELATLMTKGKGH